VSALEIVGVLAAIIGASGLLKLRGKAPPSGERLR
jgi:hypothetical protein